MTETNVHIHKYYGFNTKTTGECHHQDVFLILFSFSRGGQDALSDKCSVTEGNVSRKIEKKVRRVHFLIIIIIIQIQGYFFFVIMQ